MARYRYVGPTPTNNKDIVTVDYVEALKTQDLSSDTVDARINSAYSGYADKSTADAGDALLATKSYIDAGDATRVKIAQKDVSNGVAGLQSNGKVLPTKINLPLNQRWPRPFWSPSSYNLGEVTMPGGSTEQTIYSCNVTDPGFAYKVVVFGTADCNYASNGASDAYPVVQARIGTQIVARGVGPQEGYLTSTGLIAYEGFEYTTSNDDMGPDWTIRWNGSHSGHVKVDGHKAVWVVGGNQNDEVAIQRTNLLDRFTNTDDQRVYMFCPDGLYDPTLGSAASGFIYLRQSADGSSGVRLGIGSSTCRFQYATSGGFGGYANLGGQATTPSNYDDNVSWEVTAAGNVFTAIRNGVQELQVVDTTNVAPRGSTNRGWGFGLTAVGTFNSQTAPMSVGWIQGEDYAQEWNGNQVTLQPINMSSQTVKTGSTTVNINFTLLNASTGNPITGGPIRVSTFRPNLWVMAVPA